MEADLNLNIIDPASQTDLSVEAQTHASYHSMPAALEGDFLTHFAPGSVIDGRYNIVQQVGQGGMAAVFRAIDEQLDEEVALKVFDPFYSNDKTFLRFKRELKLSRKLSHPNIIRLHDIGSHQQFHYISMELLEGRDLEDILSMHKGVDIVFGTQILLQICSGLQAAHDIGVIHRDIKPSNFFLTDDGVLKVMDFGIAIEANSDKLTATGSVVGTGMYMAPERAMGQELISPESDLYSIGIVAFEMFTGELPFYHENIIPLLMMHVHDTPPRPSQINPHVPLLLESIILKLLAKSPGDRYDSCRELSDALRGFLRTLPSTPLER
jgi:serine/threonine-protein kinase